MAVNLLNINSHLFAIYRWCRFRGEHVRRVWYYSVNVVFGEITARYTSTKSRIELTSAVTSLFALLDDIISILFHFYSFFVFFLSNYRNWVRIVKCIYIYIDSNPFSTWFSELHFLWAFQWGVLIGWLLFNV